MSTTRSNKGIPAGLFLAEIGAWNLCQTAESRMKVYARDPVNGKANYAFAIKNGAIDTHAALDAAKLRDERPELYKSIEAYLKSQVEAEAPITPAEEEADPYGDLALSRRRRLTPEQNWRRGLLQLRRTHMEHVAAKKDSVWESSVRLMYAAVFKAKISDLDAQKAIHWITQCQGEVDLAKLLQIETEYYSGKYGPTSSSTLKAQLDMLSNNNDEFENVEATNGSVDGEGSKKFPGQESQSAGSVPSGSAATGGAGCEVPAVRASDAPEAELFSAFQ
jgi:hypothetical protein